MISFSNLQIPPPSNWQDFQSLCRDLWSAIWRDPDAQENGREGYPQNGVDIYGTPGQKRKLEGVQCKGKDNYTKKILTKSEVNQEVKKAFKFQPKLSKFIIATTAPRDISIQEEARKITNNNRKKRLFSVHIWSWDDIKKELEKYPDIIDKYYPGLSLNTKSLKRAISEIGKPIKALDDKTASIQDELSKLRGEIKTTLNPNIEELTSSTLKSEHQEEINQAKDLINKYQPKVALDLLIKLKKRIWDKTQPIIKFRILTNIGAAKLALTKEKEAARLFIEALQYNPEDEKGLCNYALGNYLLGNYEKTKKYANKVIAKNPTNARAHALFIQGSFDNPQIDALIETIPKVLRNTPEVAYAISHVFHRRKDIKKALVWLELALGKDKNNTPEIKADLAQLLIESLTTTESSYGLQLNDEQRELFKRAIGLLTNAWEHIKDTELRGFRVDWLINRSVARRALGEIDEAIKDLGEALELAPSNPRLIFQRALLAFDNNDLSIASSFLENILTSKQIPEAKLIYAWVLRQKKEFNKSISTVKELTTGYAPKKIKESASRLLTQLFIDIGDIDLARSNSNTSLAKEPSNILYLIDVATISRLEGKMEEALTRLNEAGKYITESTTFREKMELADEYSLLNEYDKAASIYDNIINTTINTPLTRKYLHCLYRAGEHGKAQSICQALRQKYGPLKYITEMELSIYEDIGDLTTVQKVGREYLITFTDDLEMRIRLAGVNYRAGQMEELDKFLTSDIRTESLTLESAIPLANLYAIRNQEKRALEILYEFRRNCYDNSKAHLGYIFLFIRRDKTLSQWLNVENVSIDSAVCIKREPNNQEWYIIEERKNADIRQKELDVSHHLAKSLLNRKKGDKIELKTNPLAEETVEIVEIKSKYVYAFQESLTSFEWLFPGTPGIWGGKMDLSDKEGEHPRDLEKLLDVVSKHHERFLKIQELYNKGQLTIGAYAELSGRNVIDVWNTIIFHQETGLKCCIGSREERIKAFTVLQSKPQLIIDIISLITLHILGAADDIVRENGKLGIAQSTIDVLHQIITERKTYQSKGFMTIEKEGNLYLRGDISEDAIKQNVVFLEGMLKWILDNTDLIPCKKALGLKKERKEKLDTMIGTSFIDTILIASEPGKTLYSDDERLRTLAKVEFNVDGVWTQALLMKSLFNKTIDKVTYNKYVIKLAYAHYYHTSINAEILIEAAKETKWTLAEPYITVVNILKGGLSDEVTAFNVGTNFIYELCRQTILPGNWKSFIYGLIDTITEDRNRRKIIDGLEKYIKTRFKLEPFYEKELLQTLGEWKKVHII